MKTFVGVLKCMRPKQWAKNVFVLTATTFLLPSGIKTEPLFKLGLLFAIFCLVASSVYLINDAKDVNEDRLHPKKRFRPIAAGLISVRLARSVAVVLGVGGLMLGLLINAQIAEIVAGYIGLNLVYTLWGKHIPIVDLYLVGSMYSLRVLSGFVAVSVWPTDLLGWVYLGGMLALAIELSKRKSEAKALEVGSKTRKVLEFYQKERLNLIFWLVVGTMVPVYLWVAYRFSPIMVVTVPLVPFGLYRLWKSYDAIADDIHPQEIIFRDRGILASGGLFVAVLALLALVPLR